MSVKTVTLKGAKTDLIKQSLDNHSDLVKYLKNVLPLEDMGKAIRIIISRVKGIVTRIFFPYQAKRNHNSGI